MTMMSDARGFLARGSFKGARAGLTGPLVAAAVLATLAGCAGPSATITVMQQPESAMTAQMRRFAIAPFEGPQGAGFSAAVGQTLSEQRIDGALRYQVAQGSKSVVRTASADGVILGAVNSYGVNERKYTQKRSKCVQYGGKSGGVLGDLGAKKCLRHQDVNVPCVERTAVANVSFRVFAAGSGETVLSSTKAHEASDSGCEGTTVKSRDQLMNEASASVVQQIVEAIAPTQKKAARELRDSKDGLTPASAQRFELGIEFASAGDMGRACGLWEEIEQSGELSIALNYNLAICDESRGDVASALERIREAISSSSSVDEELLEEERRYEALL